MLRKIAYFFSIICHPLWMPIYMLVILLLINPYLFGVSNFRENGRLLFMVLMVACIIPAIAILMMKGLGLIKSLEMHDRYDRIGPYIATGIFYLWVFKSLHADTRIPVIYTSAMLGATIAVFIAFFLNLFTKVSMHTIGMGGMVGMLLITMRWFSYGTFKFNNSEVGVHYLLMMAILLSGIVGTSRLLLQAHQTKEIYGGFLIGLATQFIAIKFLL